MTSLTVAFHISKLVQRHHAEQPAPFNTLDINAHVFPRSFGERYLSTVLFNNLWSKDADAEAQMPSAWQKQSGEESTGGSSSEIIPKL